jgi:hypothetical protein
MFEEVGDGDLITGGVHSPVTLADDASGVISAEQKEGLEGQTHDARDRGCITVYGLCMRLQRALNAWTIRGGRVGDEVHVRGRENKRSRLGGKRLAVSDWRWKCKGNLNTEAETKFETRKDKGTVPPP